MNPVQFNRTPYKVTYYKEGVKHEIRRVPPPKLHDMWPQDKVELTSTRNADFQEGDVVKVKNINPRSPNTLQVEDSSGNTTFVAYYGAKLNEAIGPRDGVDPKELPVNNRYLNWP